MSVRNSARAGAFAFAVLGSSLFAGATGATAQASSSLTIVQNGSDSVSVYNMAGNGATNHAAPTNVTSST